MPLIPLSRLLSLSLRVSAPQPSRLQPLKVAPVQVGRALPDVVTQGRVPVGYWRNNPDIQEQDILGMEDFVRMKASGQAMGGSEDPDGGVAAYLEEQEALPRVEDTIDLSWDPKERAAVATYLDRGIAGPVQSRGWSNCRICGKNNGSQDLGDDKFIWPSGFSHYVREHGVKPPLQFIQHALKQ